MTRFLWTGESEFCMCGHHVTDHETSQWLVSIITQQPPIVTYRERGGDKSHIIRSCDCDEFRPYKIVKKEDDEEAIENQNTEVIEG
jgi:hypothetical protein